MAINVSIPKGTRDFSPDEMIRRNYIFDTIKSVFIKYGYQPIETPAMENLSTLMGKYGEEGDRLIFKIINSGDPFSNIRFEDIEDDLLREFDAKQINDEYIFEGFKSRKILEKSIRKYIRDTYFSEKALRYDLTVPFARFIVMNRNNIMFPFKRYQIQPVWRADRPQKGRYREFFQCDVDVIGTTSLLNELELIQIIDDVFRKLGLSVTVKLNNRKILTGIAEFIGEPDKITDITVAIDKLDKIGRDAVLKELKDKGLNDDSRNKLLPLLELSKGNNNERLLEIRNILNNSPVGLKGCDEMAELFDLVDSSEIDCNIDFDITLARGLNYYTGTIFEVKSNELSFGSICGGGRYDDLTGIFGMPDTSGVGVSFGADRIYDVLNELKKFPENVAVSTQVLFVNFGIAEAKYCLKLVTELRTAGINSELYPDVAKMKKQMSYADYKKIPFVAIVGEDEIKTGQVTLKNMKTGEQNKLTVSEIIAVIQNN